MNVLIIHHEAEYFAGAEKVLGYFLDGLRSTQTQITVAAVEQSRVRQIIPEGVTPCWLPSNAKFSPIQFLRQAGAIRRSFRASRFDLVHGWAARDWELTATVGKLLGRPALGTLHDHPKAPFISATRQRLMAWSARAGLKKVVCVSEALRHACVRAHYQPGSLAVVRNGLPPSSQLRPPRAEGPFRLGYLGQITERKGVRGLFEILDQVSALTPARWELVVAGEAQEAQGKRLVEELKRRYATKAWWPQVRWCGWVKKPLEFLASIDLLICPSSDFDPFPTVVLEAGQTAVAVLGAEVGGVPEMIAHAQTGWLFPAQDWAAAAVQLKQVLEAPDLALQAGLEAKKRVERQFTIGTMVENYLNVYTELTVI